MKVATYEYIDRILRGVVFIGSDEELEGSKVKVRTSEYAEVEFLKRPAEDVVPEQIAGIEREIEQATTEFAKTLNKLKAAKAELLAITDQSIAA